MTDIFLSYSSKDRERVRPLRDALAAAGYSVFWDQEVSTGTNWNRLILQRVSEARLVLVVWSKTSVTSDPVIHEASVAREDGKLMPCMVDVLTVRDMPIGFHTTQAAALHDWAGQADHSGFRDLMRAVHARLKPGDVAALLETKPSSVADARMEFVAANPDRLVIEKSGAGVLASPLDAWRTGDSAVRALVVLQISLAATSYIATMWGFIDLMKIDLPHEINNGTLDGGDIVSAVIVVAIASAVVVTMIVGLSAMLDRERSLVGRSIGGVVYTFFVFWSIAFGYGFFWKTLASEDFTRANFQRQTAAIQSTIDGVMDSLRGVEFAAHEASSKAHALSNSESDQNGGGTCENNRNSIGGQGPLTIARATFAVEADHVANALTQNWSSVLEQRAGDLAWRIQALDPEADLEFDPHDLRMGRPQTTEDGVALEEIKRRVRMGAEGRRLAYDDVKTLANQFVRTANQLRRDVGGPARAKLRDLAVDMSVQGDRSSNNFCKDTGLAAIMNQAANSIAAIAEVQPIKFKAVEGAEATRFAVMNLGRHALSFVGSLVGLGSRKESLTPLSEADVVALYATSAIDFALLMASILARPPAPRRRPKAAADRKI